MAITLDVANVGEFAVDTAGSSVAVTTSAAAAAGSTVIVTGTLFDLGSTVTATSVADNGPGLIWTVDKNGAALFDGRQRVFIASAYAPAGLASGRTITVTFSGSVAGGRSVAATSFLGVASSSRVDTTSGPTDTTTGAWTSASTTIAAGSLLIAVSLEGDTLYTSTITAPSIEAHDLGVVNGFAQTTGYRIQASAGAYTVAGTWSGPASGTTIAVAYKVSAGATAPTVPQSVSATPGNAQIILNWSAPASNGGSAITAYKIYRSLSPGTETLFASPAGTGTTYTDVTTANGTTYYYKVTAVNAIGESALSSEVFGTPSLGAVPAAPQTLTATAGVSQVSLAWAVPPIYPSNSLLPSNTDISVTSYKIYRGLTSNSETLLASPAGLATAYVDSTAVAGTAYFYKVTAVNAGGEGSFSNEASATPTSGSTAPTAPVGLGTVAGDAQIALSWSVPVSNGGSAITGYKIYRGLTSNSETLLASPAGTGTAYTDLTTANGTTYFYKVTAVNAVGESALSNEASGVPSAPVVTTGRTFKRFYGPAELSNAAATLYICPASTTGVIQHIHASNPSGSSVNFTLSIGAATAPNDLWDAAPIAANDVLDHYQDFTLNAGDIIQGFASVGATLNLTIDGFELA